MKDFFILCGEGAAFTASGFLFSCPWPFWLAGVCLIAFGLMFMFAGRAPLLDDFDREPAAPIDAQQRTIGRR